ncbi:MAG: exodeoxyribonuclease-3 [bacterium]|jgi:exodeoxyribonuclease-3
MKLISWNVNGIRAAVKKGFLDFMEEQNPDVICLQEVKAEEEQAALELSQYTSYWNSAEKKGYSGTAILSKKEALNCRYGIGNEKHDQEGRVITLEFDEYFLVTVYTPNSKRGLERLDYRQNEWDVDFLAYVKELEASKPVVFCGDLNVAHQDIDLANPKTNHKNAGFTDEERKGINNIIDAGFIDTFREFNQEGGNYTWWSYMRTARDRNIGWRIDYFCISSTLRPQLRSAAILSNVMGSDHCPISIELD